MSKENAKKFCELMGKNPEILKEGEKRDKGQGDVYAIFSELAAEKGLDCTASELKEVMDGAKELISELGDDDLEDVAGGGGVIDVWNRINAWIRGWMKAQESDWEYQKEKWKDVYEKNFKNRFQKKK